MSSNQQAEAYYALMLGGITPGIYLSGELPDAVIGEAYSASLTLHGATGPVFWEVVGLLPPGLFIDSATGVISGAPAAAFQILPVDLTVMVGSTIDVPVQTIGGYGPASFCIVEGSLPSALSLVDGRIVGTVA
ncbi:hypothetical protein CSC62_14130 [Pseudoxanthomonas jiangsuensis]|uniref:putative Ig domain-containing protein n=1 Tax=Pseudoxanthomonas jiangsuensis TaxID=619688 RepID=UPI00139136D9|nr:putative Ig domain-containing protein [Pseudoxanthomonas jiangsuensis]KAF1692768.1 hypothetical protein CSC62_14130 [Pseudoxanthomonas jiangsuensis]